MRLTEEEVTGIIKAALREVNDMNRLALAEIFGAPQAHLALARRIERAAWLKVADSIPAMAEEWSSQGSSRIKFHKWVENRIRAAAQEGEDDDANR